MNIRYHHYFMGAGLLIVALVYALLEFSSSRESRVGRRTFWLVNLPISGFVFFAGIFTLLRPFESSIQMVLYFFIVGFVFLGGLTQSVAQYYHEKRRGFSSTDQKELFSVDRTASLFLIGFNIILLVGWVWLIARIFFK